MRKSLSLLLAVMMIISLAVPAFANSKPTLTVTADTKEFNVATGTQKVTYTIKINPNGNALKVFSFNLSGVDGLTLATSTDGNTKYNVDSSLGYHSTYNASGIFETFKYENGYFIASGARSNKSLSAEHTVLTIDATVDVSKAAVYALNVTNFIAATGGNDKDKLECATPTVDTITVAKPAITSVSVSLDAPTTGSALPTATTSETTYDIATKWYIGNQETSETTKPSTVYTAKVTLTPKSGESFASEVAAKGFTVTKSGNNLVLEKTFEQTDALPQHTITVTSPISVTYGVNTTTIAPTVGNDSAATFTFKSNDTSIVEVDAQGKLTPKKYGTTTVTVTASATATHSQTTKDVTVNVARASQTITASDMTVTLGETGKTVTATTSGNGVVTFAVNSGSSVSVTSVGALTINSVGETTIRVTAAQTDQYNSATKDIKVTVTGKVTVPTGGSYTYDGTEKTAVAGYDESSAYTLTGDVKATNAKENYSATAKLKSCYKWANEGTNEKTITWSIAKATPTAEHFTFTAPTDLTYSNSAKAATVALKSNYTGAGTITVKYAGTGGTSYTESTTAPTAAGTYKVSIAVADGTNFNATTPDLTNDNWTFTIAKQTPEAPTLSKVNPTKADNDGKITGLVSNTKYQIKGGYYTDWQDVSDDTTEITGLKGATYQVRVKGDGVNINDGTPVSIELVTPGAISGTVTITGATNGTAAVGTELGVDVSKLNYSGTLSYKWLNNGAEISNADDETYTLTVEDVGDTITVQVESTENTGSKTSDSVTVYAYRAPTITPADGSEFTEGDIVAVTITHDNEVRTADEPVREGEPTSIAPDPSPASVVEPISNPTGERDPAQQDPEEEESPFVILYRIDGGEWTKYEDAFTVTMDDAKTINAFVTSRDNYKHMKSSVENGTLVGDEQVNAESCSAISTVNYTFKTERKSHGGTTNYYVVHTYIEGQGTVEPVNSKGDKMVRSGEDQEFTFTPAAGWEIGDIVVNGKSVGAVKSYTVKNIDHDMNIEITFVKNGTSVITSTPADSSNPTTGAAI